MSAGSANKIIRLSGSQKRAAQEFFDEKIAGAEWVGVSNQFFAALITPLGDEGDRCLGSAFRGAKEK